MNIRIAIADDHQVIVNGVQKIISNVKHITLTHTYLNGEELLAGLEKALPDVLLLDIQLPGKTGDKLVPLILKRYPELRILAFTNFDSIFYAKNMLSHGALGFLLKSTDPKTLVTAIETVYGYQEFLEPSIKRQIEEKHLKANRVSAEYPVLTPREKEVIQLVVDGYTSKEIAEQLHLGIDTIENYRFNLIIKLGVKNTAMLIKKAVQTGLVQ